MKGDQQGKVKDIRQYFEGRVGESHSNPERKRMRIERRIRGPASRKEPGHIKKMLPTKNV